jgi:hypothetical protein
LPQARNEFAPYGATFGAKYLPGLEQFECQTIACIAFNVSSRISLEMDTSMLNSFHRSEIKLDQPWLLIHTDLIRA